MNNGLNSSDTGRGCLFLYNFKGNKLSRIFSMWTAADLFRISGDCVHFDHFSILLRKNADSAFFISFPGSHLFQNDIDLFPDGFIYDGLDFFQLLLCDLPAKRKIKP